MSGVRIVLCTKRRAPEYSRPLSQIPMELVAGRSDAARTQVMLYPV